MQPRPTALAHAHGANLSTAIGKFHNAGIVHFKLKMHVHELVRVALACLKLLNAKSRHDTRYDSR
jgi:hypothetical protein